MRILGLDVSTFVGMCLLVDPDQTDSQVKSLLINYPKLRGYERLQSIARGVAMVVDEWQPDVVFIEWYAFGGCQIVQMVEVGTFIRKVLYDRGLDWYDCTPSTVKLFTTGKGNAKKPDMAAAVQQRWGFTHKSDDVIDAFAIAKLGQHVLTLPETPKGVKKWNDGSQSKAARSTKSQAKAM
jgi:crossover junction endodeoxyribonuclease RuvC